MCYIHEQSILIERSYDKKLPYEKTMHITRTTSYYQFNAKQKLTPFLQ